MGVFTMREISGIIIPLLTVIGGIASSAIVVVVLFPFLRRTRLGKFLERRKQGVQLSAHDSERERRDQVQRIISALGGRKDSDGETRPDVAQRLPSRGTQTTNPSNPPSAKNSPAARLRRLEQMRQAEMITQEEYDAKRAEILKEM
jgi:hypothetical protein